MYQIKALLTTIALVFLFFTLAPITKAVIIEQQINFIDREFSTTNLTDSPTDNSLGLISFDPANYNGETVYFEALIRCDTCSGGNARTEASLVTEAGSFATSVNTTSSTYTLVRSGSLTLSQTNYTVRIKVDATSGTAYIKAARLVIVQNAASITDTNTQIEIGNNESFGVSTSAVALTDKKIWHYDAFNFSDTSSTQFAATVWSASGGVTAYACIYKTDGTEVGCVSTTNTTPTYPTPATVTLADNTNYEVRLKSSSGTTSTVYLANAKIILSQSQGGGIKRFETYHQYLNTSAYDYDSTYSLQAAYNQFDPSHVSGGESYYFFESTLKAAAGSAYAQVYNYSDTAAITNGEVATGETSYSRVRSQDLAAYLPATVKTLDVQIKNSGLNTTVVANSWLITNLIVDPSLSLKIEPVNSGVVNNAITTSVSSTYSTLPFGNIGINTPKYIAHKLSVTANTNAGYSLMVKLLSALQGVYPANHIDPFAAPGATWSTPAVWSSPTGTSKNVDTAWIGANTTDTRVTGWSSAAQKFGPLDTTEIALMQSSGGDAGTTAYVTYALESNVLQPADLYSGTLLYNILPGY